MLNREYATRMALDLGFDLVGFAQAGPVPGAQQFLDWLRAGYAGEMSYLVREPARRLDPRLVLPGVRTVMMVGLSYDSLAVPEDILSDPSRGRIARYAWGLDYHDVLIPRLRELGERLTHLSRAYVDTGPVLERSWAKSAGLGFIGRNTCLINPSRGSHLFLGAILLSEEVDHWEPERTNRQYGCGQCTRCLVACPTHAFIKPSLLDARRCISYLTIELKGSIPIEFRASMGNRIFGCDVCQDVCPYVRRFSRPTRELAFHPDSPNRVAPSLLELLAMDRTTFGLRFKGTPLERSKWRGIVRNVCVAAGNWGDSQALPLLEKLKTNEEPIIQEHAAWAITRIIAKQGQPTNVVRRHEQTEGHSTSLAGLQTHC